MLGSLKIWLLCSIFLTFLLYSKAQVYQFKCFQQATYAYVHTGDTNWVDTNYVVIFDFRKKTVDLYNKASMDYEINGFQPLRTDPKGNTIVCSAVDKEGNECTMELTLFRQVSFHVATLVVRYGDVIYSYRLKNAKT